MARKVARLALFAVTLTGAACNPFPETWEWNQKLTLEVATPQGVKAGSAVTHVTWQEENAVGNYPSAYEGEATIVEVQPGRYLFALIGENTKYIALRAFAPELGGKASITPKGFAAVSRLRGTADVPRQYYPLLVTFADIDDPKTVRKVDPDDLAASFGPGVALKRVTLAITDEPATEGEVERTLGPHFFQEWTKLTHDALSRGGIKDPFFKTVAADFSRNDFIRE